MSGTTPAGSPPPEVPEEFAAAYRAAYERALAAQSPGPQHRDDPTPPDEVEDEADEDDDAAVQTLPRRRGPSRVGTHRTAAEEYDDDRLTWFESIRGSTWFVPLLLALLALLLILGAYALGRGFSGQLDGGRSSGTGGQNVDSPGGDAAEPEILAAKRDHRNERAVSKSSLAVRPDQVSRIIVTGPSLASSTLMSAPKTPRSTLVPCCSRPAQTAL